MVIRKVRDEKIPKQTPKEEEPQTTQTSDSKPEEVQIRTDLRKEQSVFVLQPSTKQDKPIRVPSIHSKVFKNFLKQENELSLQENPEQLDTFDQSFEPPTLDYPAEQTDQRTLIRHLNGVGVGMTEDEKGRRTCYALIQIMLDISAAPAVLSRDCTLPKRFEFSMNKPNNGWMDR